jgi:membrane protein
MLVCLAFTFVYIFVPNTKVNYRSALVGGIVGGVLWETVGWGFASFVVTSTKYTAIYSGFAILVLFMIWLYLSWLILLTGGVVTFYHQHPKVLAIEGNVRFHHRLMERAAFLIMFLVGHNFYHNKGQWNTDLLVDRLGLPLEPVQNIVKELVKSKLLIETGDDPQGYLPARAMETITLGEILETVRFDNEKPAGQQKALHIKEIERLEKDIEAAIKSALHNKALRDVVVAHKGEISGVVARRKANGKPAS